MRSAAKIIFLVDYDILSINFFENLLSSRAISCFSQCSRISIASSIGKYLWKYFSLLATLEGTCVYIRVHFWNV